MKPENPPHDISREGKNDTTFTTVIRQLLKRGTIVLLKILVETLLFVSELIVEDATINLIPSTRVRVRVQVVSPHSGICVRS